MRPERAGNPRSSGAAEGETLGYLMYQPLHPHMLTAPAPFTTEESSRPLQPRISRLAEVANWLWKVWNPPITEEQWEELKLW